MIPSGTEIWWPSVQCPAERVSKNYKKGYNI
jgi:hypothetical protein